MKKTDKTASQDVRPVYVLCPRCEINYIDKKDKYCAVCKAELGMGDPSIFLPEDDESQSERICPVCHINLLAEDEEICIECKKESEEKEKESKEVSGDEDNPADWEPFADEEEEEIPDGMQEIFADEEEEEEEDDEIVETVSDEPDDFDFNVDPNDFVEDDEEEEDDL